MKSHLCAAVALLGAAARPAEIPLVRDGRPAATVVIGAQASPVARFAAAEFVGHIRRATGAELPVAADTAPVTGPRVLIGPSAAVQACGVDTAALGSQEYVIRHLPGTLILAGREDAAPGRGPRYRRVPGRHGQALDFDGDKDRLIVEDCGFRDEAGTLEAWVWLPAEKPQRCHGTILRLDGTDPWTYHILQRDQNSSAISYATYDGREVHGLRSGDLPEGWHHVAASWSVETGRMALWVDGTLQGETAYVKTTCAGAPLGIGAMASQFGNPFRGRIDEVRLSTRARAVPAEAAGGPYAADDSTACLFHFDEPEGDPLDSAGGLRRVPPPDLFGENGTLYAVYDVLERVCGVRWYAPGDWGTVCPQAANLTAAGPDVRRAPAMIHRWVTPTAFYLPGPPDRVPARELHLWKLRQRIGGQAFWVCHSFEGYYDRFLKDHPDWFAQGYPGRPPQLCYTHPDLIRQVVQDARDYFDGKGKHPGATAEGDVFGLVPMDNNQWCRCPRCQAEMNQAQMGNQQFNNGKASNYIWGFVEKVAAEIRRSHPGKWIGALAYSDYAYLPDTVTPGPNVVVQLCLHTRNWWCPSMEANDLKVLDDWRRQDPERPLYLWLYYCFPALNAKYGDFAYFPGFFAHAVVRQMGLYRQARIRGIFMEHSSEFGQTMLMDQLEFYVTLKLADDPSLDGNALIEEFFERYYGAAAGPMAELYGRIERTFCDPANYPEAIRTSPAHQHQTEDLAWGSLGTPERMAEFAALMARAEAAAVTPEEQARVNAFRRGIWEPMLAGRQRYEARLRQRAEPIRTVRVPRTADAGGDPNRVDFAALAPLPGWGSLSGEPTTRRLELRAAHDGRFLYLQMTEWTETRDLVPGPQVWDGDDWEFFAAAQRNAACRQLCVAPDGRTFRAAHKGNTPVWDPGEKAISDTAAADRWTVRLALPLDRLLPVPLTGGSSFYANVYRASPGASRLLAWAPTFGSGFHETDRLPEWTLE